MRQCVACIEDYTRHDPSNAPNRATTQHALAQLQSFPEGVQAIDPRLMEAPAPSQAQAPTSSAATTTQAVAGTKKTKAAAVEKEKPAKKEKKEKKVKDPNQPKRPASAYLLFQNEVRPNLQLAETEMSYLDAMKKVSEMWKDLTPEQRKVSLGPLTNQ